MKENAPFIHATTRSSGSGQNVRRQRSVHHDNFTRKNAIFEHRIEGDVGEIARATSVAWQSLSLREDRGYYLRNNAIFEPTGTPTSSATGWHFTAIRYATGGRSWYMESDS